MNTESYILSDCNQPSSTSIINNDHHSPEKINHDQPAVIRGVAVHPASVPKTLKLVSGEDVIPEAHRMLSASGDVPAKKIAHGKGESWAVEHSAAMAIESYQLVEAEGEPTIGGWEKAPEISNQAWLIVVTALNCKRFHCEELKLFTGMMFNIFVLAYCNSFQLNDIPSRWCSWKVLNFEPKLRWVMGVSNIRWWLSFVNVM